MSELKLSKKDKAKLFYENHENLLICPYCQEHLTITEYTMACHNHHSFDVSKKGYINLASTKGDDHYNHAFFEARKTMLHDGLFLEIENNIQSLINEHTLSNKTLTLLDAGTGEGALLSSLYLKFKKVHPTFIGLDLSKEAIAMATSEEGNIGWLVGDLANIPLQNQSVDIILNLFSPANYNQFKRVLKPKGYLIKVIPQENHFREVRKAIKMEAYDKGKTELIKETLSEYCEVKSSKRLSYRFPLTSQQQELVISMSPLSSHKPPKIGMMMNYVTVDVEVIVARFKE